MDDLAFTRVETWATTGNGSPPQAIASLYPQRTRPTAYGLSADPELPSHFRLVVSLQQQIRGLPPPSLEANKISCPLDHRDPRETKFGSIIFNRSFGKKTRRAAGWKGLVRATSSERRASRAIDG